MVTTMATQARFHDRTVLVTGGLGGIGLACALLLILRTALEDRTLQAELPGYADYARQVRYRLLPGVW